MERQGRRSPHSEPMRCDHCRKSFGLIFHRYFRMRFCSADCLEAYQRRRCVDDDEDSARRPVALELKRSGRQNAPNRVRHHRVAHGHRGHASPQGAARDCAVRKTECLSSELALAHMRQ